MSKTLVIIRNNVEFKIDFKDSKKCTVNTVEDQINATYDQYIKAICFNGSLTFNNKNIKGIKLQESENDEVKNIIDSIEEEAVNDIISGKTLLNVSVENGCHINYSLSCSNKALLEKAFKQLTNRELDLNKLNRRLGNLRTKEEIEKDLKAHDFEYSKLAAKAYNLKDTTVTDFKIALKDLIDFEEIEEANKKDNDIKAKREKMNVKILKSDKDKIGSIFATVEISNDIEKAIFKVSNISDFGYSVTKVSECSKDFEKEAEKYLYEFPPVCDEFIF